MLKFIYGCSALPEEIFIILSEHKYQIFKNIQLIYQMTKNRIIDNDLYEVIARDVRNINCYLGEMIIKEIIFFVGIFFKITFFEIMLDRLKMHSYQAQTN